MPSTGDAAPVVHSTYGTQQPAVRAWKDYKAVTRDLKQVYHTATEEGALQALDAFGKEWDARYPQISRSWQANWPNVATFFVYRRRAARL